MRKQVFAYILLALFLGVMGYLYLDTPLFADKGREAPFRSWEKKVQYLEGEQWIDFEVKGISVGTGYPGVFPNEYGIDEETYLRWFRLIAEMNANTLRVYKLQSPAFYNAFARYNRESENKLYLLQGVGFDENRIFSEENLLKSDYKQTLFRETTQVVDAIHGSELLCDWKSGELRCYSSDVSEYVMGYILGIEWDEIFVSYLNRINTGYAPYQGEYVCSREDAEPFEIFLAEWVDRTIRYEQSEYHCQRLLSVCNWPETDPFCNELSFVESLAEGQMEKTEAFVDIDKLQCTDRVRCGLFASYNVYPYFPSFLQHGPYCDYVDDTGAVNPYRGYLTELTKHHTYPVIVTEFGIPTSRSTAYADSIRGFSHGGKNEQEQCEALTALYEDICAAGCAGSIAFAWQDEWYKTVWNDKLLSDPDQRAYWSNAQSAEQFYGVLAFEPGAETPYPDGDLSDWDSEDILSEDGGLRLSMQSDEKYVYFLLQSEAPLKQPVCVAMDVTPRSGADSLGDTGFDRAVDFILRLDPEGETRLYVDEYYDTLAFSALGGYVGISFANLTTVLDMYKEQVHRPRLGESFVEVSRASGDVQATIDAIWLQNEAGLLKKGNANPASPDYDSNADYFLGESFAEIRIPWQLLNFRDPSECCVVDDYHDTDYRLRNRKVEAIYAALFTDGQDSAGVFGKYPLHSWEEPTFHERLKPAYYALQEAFGREMEP